MIGNRLRVKAVAERWKVSRRWINQLVLDGKLKAIKDGGDWFISLSSVEKFEKEGLVAPNPERVNGRPPAARYLTEDTE